MIDKQSVVFSRFLLDPRNQFYFKGSEEMYFFVLSYFSFPFPISKIPIFEVNSQNTKMNAPFNTPQ